MNICEPPMGETLDVAVVILAGRIVNSDLPKSDNPLYPTPIEKPLADEALYFVAQDRDHVVSGQGIDQLRLKGHHGDTLSWRSTTITFGSRFLVPLYNFEALSEDIIGEPEICQLEPEEYVIRITGIHEATKELEFDTTQVGLGIWRSDISQGSGKYNISFMIIEPDGPEEIVGYYSFETELEFTDQ